LIIFFSLVSLTHFLADDVVVMNIFCFLDGFHMARLASVCRDWRDNLNEDIVWKVSCEQVWPDEPKKSLQRRFKEYNCSWKQMFIHRPHIRFDGAYLLATTYAQHIERDLLHPFSRSVESTYYRYLQFEPHGKVYYCLTNEKPKLSRGPIPHNDPILRKGTYKCLKGEVHVRVDIGNMIAYMQLECLSGEQGAHNRIVYTNFWGKSERDSEPVRFPIPKSEFNFYRTSTSGRPTERAVPVRLGAGLSMAFAGYYSNSHTSASLSLSASATSSSSHAQPERESGHHPSTSTSHVHWPEPLHKRSVKVLDQHQN